MENMNKDNAMHILVSELWNQKMLYYLIAALSSDENLDSIIAKESSITQLKEILKVVTETNIIPEDKQENLKKLIEKSIEICENKKFEE